MLQQLVKACESENGMKKEGGGWEEREKRGKSTEEAKGSVGREREALSVERDDGQGKMYTSGKVRASREQSGPHDVRGWKFWSEDCLVFLELGKSGSQSDSNTIRFV